MSAQESGFYRLDESQGHGREVVRTFQVALRLGRTHGWSNDAGVGALQAMADTVNTVVATRGEFGLHVAGDFLYLDDLRLRMDGMSYGFLEILIGEITTRGVGSVFFAGQVNTEHLRYLLDLLNAHSVGDEETAANINDQLENADCPISVGPVREMKELMAVESEQVGKRERCKKAFFKAVTVTKAVMTKAHLGQRLELRQAKRVMQNMVDLMMDEEFTLLGLTTIKDHDNYTFYHSVNVSIYSLALGKRAGFNRNQLAELGVAALFHDLGKSKVPLAILRKKEAFNPDEWAVMRAHPEMGVKELVKMRGLSSLAFKSMVASFEHHLNYNAAPGGYPKLRRPYRPHVIGRIVAIADCFDAMTTKRSYVKKATPRDKALSFMMSQAGAKFDPVLMRLFANMVGVFPVGTVVRLQSGRLAVVEATPEDANLCHRPIVRPITDASGIQREFESLDLSQRSLDGGYPDEIITTVDGEDLGIDISKYFI